MKAGPRRVCLNFDDLGRGSHLHLADWVPATRPRPSDASILVDRPCPNALPC
jgi:hypothetical protein